MMKTAPQPSDSSPKEKIILGIDPGTNLLGYGLVRVTGKKVEMMAMGVIDMRKCADGYLKLGRIYERVMGIIDAFHPDELAIEAPFFGKNVQSMLKLGRAQGVAIAAAISRQIPIQEYAPMKIKMSITGNGQASKQQVAAMINRMLMTDYAPRKLDATDGMAVALCHWLTTSNTLTQLTAGDKRKGLGGDSKSRKGSSSWEQFAESNPERIKK